MRNQIAGGGQCKSVETQKRSSSMRFSEGKKAVQRLQSSKLSMDINSLLLVTRFYIMVFGK